MRGREVWPELCCSRFPAVLPVLPSLLSFDTARRDRMTKNEKNRKERQKNKKKRKVLVHFESHSQISCS